MVETARPFVILIAGEPIPQVRAKRGSYAEIIRKAAGAPERAWRDVDLRAETVLPDPAAIAAVIVTGSSASVTEQAPWMLRAQEYLCSLVHHGVPLFGICFGHQLLAQALGGEVVRNPRGREIGTVDFETVERDPLLSAATAPFRANATHADTVGRLPHGARVLARTALDPHAAVRFSDHAWGVQFHPETDREIAADYLSVRRELLEGEGIDVDALLACVGDGESGASTLVSFLEIASGRESSFLAPRSDLRR